MDQVLLGSLIFTVTRCASDVTSADASGSREMAAKMESAPTILKVFIKGDIQEEDIEKLLNLSTSDENLPNNSPHFTRNRRNSVADYIGKLYSFNRLLRPYRSIFRGLNHDQTTSVPWLRKLLGGRRAESRTEGFWGMALGAHTFSPLARPVSLTRMPYHRIRDQQKIDRLLGITRDYEPTIAEHLKPTPFDWIENRQTYVNFVLQAKSHKEQNTPAGTTEKNEQGQQVSTRAAFHRAPFNVAGLKTINYSLRHKITSPRRLKFCEKQCPEEKEEERTRKPGSTDSGRPGNIECITPSESQPTTPCNRMEDGTTEDCNSTVLANCSDCSSEREDEHPQCKNVIKKRVSPTTTKRRKVKMTTWKFTRSKETRITRPIWTLPPNPVLHQSQMEERQVQITTTMLPQTEDKTGPSSRLEINPITPKSALDSSELSTRSGCHSNHHKAGSGKPRCPCRKPKQPKQVIQQCPHLPIPTRTHNSMCSTINHATTCSTTQSTTCECQSQERTCADTPEPSVGETSEQDKPTEINSGCSCDQNKGKPQKIVVRISSALGEVPVVIMRDNGVCGVSLSVVNDYILDENNRLIKCLGQKPVGRHTNGSTLHHNGCKGAHFIPQLIRNQLHGLQPKRYSFRLQSKRPHKLLQGSRMVQGNSVANPYPEVDQNLIAGLPIPNLFPPYKLFSPDSQRMGNFRLPIPHFLGSQYPRRYEGFKMGPADSSNSRLNDPPIAQMNLDEYSSGNNVGPTAYPRFRTNQEDSLAGLNLRQFEPAGLNLQQAAGFPQPGSDTSQLFGYRSPFLPMLYPSKNYIQPPKYIMPGLQ